MQYSLDMWWRQLVSKQTFRALALLRFKLLMSLFVPMCIINKSIKLRCIYTYRHRKLYHYTPFDIASFRALLGVLTFAKFQKIIWNWDIHDLFGAEYCENPIILLAGGGTTCDVMLP